MTEGWSEGDSEAFIQVGRIVTPRRDELEQAFLSLLPAGTDEEFLAVEIGCGDGWLSRAVLERFPKCRLIALDRSERMLEQAAETLAPYQERVELRGFELEDSSWLDDLPPVRAFLSSLVIHHVDGRAKRDLYQRLYDQLQPGGALLIHDLIAPTSERERRYLAEAWYRQVHRQSVEMTGNTQIYDHFVAEHSNIYEYPDPIDMPSPLPDQLDWLRGIAFTGVDAFRVLAAHALYGGYRAS